MLVWNLPLHVWCWDMIKDVLRPVGELVAMSQAQTPHKEFLSVLVRRREGVALPMEIELSLGMRRYVVLVTGERCVHPVYRRELGHFVLTEKEGVVGAVNA